jgi:23S rRNA (pseudouridine1915-N3)-methyltransferase
LALALDILAGGRAKAAPESELAQAYLQRARDGGRALGLTSFVLSEWDERKPERLIDACAGGVLLVALDERGTSLTSEAFAKQIARWRDVGEARALFVIGGPDGLPDDVKRRAQMTIAFGTQTWPHLLVRTMLAEQLFRAVIGMSGENSHRA